MNELLQSSGNFAMIDTEVEPTDVVVSISNPTTNKLIVEILYNGDVKLYGEVSEGARVFWDWVKLHAEKDIKRLILEGKISKEEAKDV